MASTIAYEIGEEGWEPVASGPCTVAIQLAQQGQIEVHISLTEPTTADVGLLIAQGVVGVPNSISFSDVPAGATCYLRAKEGDVRVIVLSY